MGVLRVVQKRVSIKNFVRLNSFHLAVKIQTNKFFNRQLFCMTLKTSSGHPDNRSWSIWPQKQPLSRAHFSQFQPISSSLRVE